MTGVVGDSPEHEKTAKAMCPSPGESGTPAPPASPSTRVLVGAVVLKTVVCVSATPGWRMSG